MQKVFMILLFLLGENYHFLLWNCFEKSYVKFSEEKSPWKITGDLWISQVIFQNNRWWNAHHRWSRCEKWIKFWWIVPQARWTLSGVNRLVTWKIVRRETTHKVKNCYARSAFYDEKIIRKTVSQKMGKIVTHRAPDEMKNQHARSVWEKKIFRRKMLEIISKQRRDHMYESAIMIYNNL